MGKINSNSGRPIINLDGDDKEDSNQLPPEVGNVIQTAENNLDLRSMKKRRGRKEIAIQRTYQIKLANIQKMEMLADTQGADFSWQINRALEHWFSTVHPEISLPGASNQAQTA
jgi:hypothetical protein